jgi:small GTP-binding protein
MDLENFKKIVQCGIHISELNDPIVLKCQHAFCRSCILKFIKDCDRQNKTRDCPICNKSIIYTADELINLPASIFHKNLIETIHTQKNQDESIIDLVSNEIKISLLGSSSCGKSSLMRCLAGLPFNDRINCTIGVDFITVNVKNGDKMLTKVYLWDTAGQELYRTMIRYYYRNSKGIILVYDMTNETSFIDIELWLEQIKQNCDNDDELVILLIGNKTDLLEQRVVTYERARQLANRYNLLYFETSAKTGENVYEALERLVAKINSFIQFSQYHEYTNSNRVLLGNVTKNYNSNCFCS